ncbi:GHMP kinase [uncultured Megasphaera sp.]|uniref:GHMP family kinase ATP-binding protein n=1 Tax=uncultured Megasphaera sp. TaxID=165188 RepID=UPI0025ED9B20|nr:GHMP kinase [uncultured Megasphaera sp.]
MELIVRVPGSCGEIMQGYWHDEPFLVTCPIDRYSTVTVRPGTGRLMGGGVKAKWAFDLARDYCRVLDLPYDFCLTSDLPVGKGMASSSADICAVLAAVGAASGRRIREEDIGRLAASIEPTDGVFCRGLAVIEPDTGEIRDRLHPVPDLAIAVFDAGGTVDTVTFHGKGRARRHPDSTAIAAGLALLERPLTPEKLGKAATYSALANQVLLEKPDFPAFVAAALPCPGVVGVNTAHSGTVAGVFFKKGREGEVLSDIVRPLTAQFPQWTYAGTVHLQSGGIFIERR